MTSNNAHTQAAIERHVQMRNRGELEIERRGVAALIVETDEINERLWRSASTSRSVNFSGEKNDGL